jgi:hypothetical protein
VEPDLASPSDAEWEQLDLLIRSGPRHQVAPDVPESDHLTPDERVWCLAYVRSGGDRSAASSESGLDPSLAPELLRRPIVRGFIAICWARLKEALAEAHSQELAARPRPIKPRALPAPSEPLAPLEAASTRPEPAPEDIASMAETLAHATATIRASIGDFIVLDPEAQGGWRFDPAAIKAAPPGVIKGVVRDRRTGEIQLTMADTRDARTQLFEYWAARSGMSGGKAYTDTREAVRRVLSGDHWEAVDAVARQVGDSLARELEQRRLTMMLDVTPSKKRGRPPRGKIS